MRAMPFSATARAACPPSRACAATGSASGTDGLIHSSASTPRVAASTASPSSWSHRTTSTWSRHAASSTRGIAHQQSRAHPGGHERRRTWDPTWPRGVVIAIVIGPPVVRPTVAQGSDTPVLGSSCTTESAQIERIPMPTLTVGDRERQPDRPLLRGPRRGPSGRPDPRLAAVRPLLGEAGPGAHRRRPPRHHLRPPRLRLVVAAVGAATTTTPSPPTSTPCCATSTCATSRSSASRWAAARSRATSAGTAASASRRRCSPAPSRRTSTRPTTTPTAGSTTRRSRASTTASPATGSPSSTGSRRTSSPPATAPTWSASRRGSTTARSPSSPRRKGTLDCIRGLRLHRLPRRPREDRRADAGHPRRLGRDRAVRGVGQAHRRGDRGQPDRRRSRAARTASTPPTPSEFNRALLDFLG